VHFYGLRNDSGGGRSIILNCLCTKINATTFTFIKESFHYHKASKHGFSLELRSNFLPPLLAQHRTEQYESSEIYENILSLSNEKEKLYRCHVYLSAKRVSRELHKASSNKEHETNLHKEEIASATWFQCAARREKKQQQWRERERKLFQVFGFP
jgi:hypothetical protein